MNAKELAKLLEVVVRKVVREELKPILTEVKKSRKPLLSEKPNKNKPLSEIIDNVPLKKKPNMNFSKNSTLNDILLETYDSGEWKNLNGKTFTSNQAQGFDRAAMASMLGYGDEHSRLNSMTPTIDPEGNPMNVNLEGTAIGDALTKDYSQLMKAINSKKGK